MLSWFRRVLGGNGGSSRSSPGGKTGGASRPGASAPSKQHLVETLDDLIKTPGKACYRTLVLLATTSTKEEFVDLVHCPAFVGAGIRDGELERLASLGQGMAPQKTQMFNPSVRQALIQGASIEQSIFLLRKAVGGRVSELRQFTIGRTRENDILMNDYAISRAHAVVEIRGESYYLKDLGSSNGTYVNGNLIDDRGRLLEDGDVVRFARYEFLFLTVGGLFELLKKRSVAAIDAAP